MTDPKGTTGKSAQRDDPPVIALPRSQDVLLSSRKVVISTEARARSNETSDQVAAPLIAKIDRSNVKIGPITVMSDQVDVLSIEMTAPSIARIDLSIVRISRSVEAIDPMGAMSDPAGDHSTEKIGRLTPEIARSNRTTDSIAMTDPINLARTETSGRDGKSVATTALALFTPISLNPRSAAESRSPTERSLRLAASRAVPSLDRKSSVLSRSKRTVGK